MSEPTASDLAADVRAVLRNTVGIDARPPVEAMESLDALVARVDTLTRERDDQLKITHNVYGLLVDAKRERNAAEAEREQALKDAADYLAHLKAAEAALADTRRALAEIAALRDRWALATSEEPFDSTESFWDALEVADRALAVGGKP